jgi:hypothetical protein
MPKRRSRWKIALGATALFAALALCVPLLTGFQVCRDWAFICENTGSRRGHREWFFGAETGHWYEQSELERFMMANHPTELQDKWTSYAGTGKNILGRAVLCGHGRPGPLILVQVEWLDKHVRRLDDAGKKALYDLFVSGDEERIKQEIDLIAISVAEET